MDNQISRRLRTGLLATSLSAALMIGGAAISASAQQDQDHRAPDAATQSQSSPSSTQTLPGDNNAQSPAAAPAQTAPDQDNGVRPSPDKDRDMQANPADRDHSGDSMKTESQGTEGAATESKEMRKDVKAFDKFLDSHPDVAKDLKADPSKVNDETYVSQHPELSSWLKDHASVREEIKNNPSAFMNREKAYDKNESETPKQ